MNFVARRLDAHCHQSIVFRSEVNRLVDSVSKVVVVGNHLVAVGEHHHGIWCYSLNFPCEICGGGSGVFAHGFKQDVVVAQLWQLFAHHVGIFARGHHPEVAFRANRFQTVECELNEGAAAAENIHKLFWGRLITNRP